MQKKMANIYETEMFRNFFYETVWFQKKRPTRAFLKLHFFPKTAEKLVFLRKKEVKQIMKPIYFVKKKYETTRFHKKSEVVS